MAVDSLERASAIAKSFTPDDANVLAIAEPGDYRRDPTRWGSEEVASHFPGFQHLEVRTRGATIRLRHGGSGPPLLLVHGNPENHVCWYKVAAELAKDYHVILPDLRGYGDSSLPDPGEGHINYSFRAMSEDLIDLMDMFGYDKFFVAGHDRGGRTTYRLCLDHPERIRKVCLMDIIPNAYVWTNITKNWVVGTWHWGFMAQPAPFPERLISAVPAEYFIKSRMLIRGGTGLGFLTDLAINEYIRCYTLKTITGSCHDYRATATCDFEMDMADKDTKTDLPLMLIWGARGHSPDRAQKFMGIWNTFATNIEHAEGLNCGHYIQEEVPEIIIEKYRAFFV